MTRGEIPAPPVPRKDPAGRAASPAARLLRAAVLLAILGQALAASARAGIVAKEDRVPDGLITRINVEGNVTVPIEDIRAKLLSKEGGGLHQGRIDADVKMLTNKWFSDVQAYYEKDPSGKGYILTFLVKEMPVLTYVEFKGLKHLRLKDVEETTGLKKGARADAAHTIQAPAQLKRLYEEKGYDFAEVVLVEGGRMGDRRVVIQIFEGPKLKVSDIRFVGNVFATDATLRTKITSKKAFLSLLGGKFHRDLLEEDARKLREYYQNQGFFEVKVTPLTNEVVATGEVRLTYVISEGVRYKVRKIEFEGNHKLSIAKLKEGLMMKPGEPMLETLREADRKNITFKYNEIGCISTQILPEHKFVEEGVVDVVYRIEEGEPIVLADLIIRGNDRTKDKVIRRQADAAGLIPGQLLNLNRVDNYKTRLGNLGYFSNAADPNSKPIDVKVGTPRSDPFGDGQTLDLSDLSFPRMQSPSDDPVPGAGPAIPPNMANPPGEGSSELTPFGSADPFAPKTDTPPIEIPMPPAIEQPPGGQPPMGQPPVVQPPMNNSPGLGGAPPTPPVGAGEPPGMQPSIAGMNMTDVGPDRQDPFPNHGFADVVTSVNEAPTGRFMLGVGASGWQGINGSLTLSERNFDLFNVPRTLDDLTSGNAFRGAGQDFQIQLMAGNLINRFMVSLRDPYLFDLPISGSASGYLFQRIYPDWSEARAGGRFALGRQLGPATYADVAFRIEDVEFYGYRTPAPADYLAASGHTVLASLRPTVRFDNRNSPFMPNKGQYLEFAFEQGWGTFTYPKFETEGRVYFTTGSRPDGSGPRILTLRGHFGVSGRDTPVYERFFAGYAGSLRGFQYRGVGPHVLGSNIGGIMMAVGTVEYMIPLTANDAVRQVFFCDFGSVEDSYDLNNFRASVGTGLRVTIPQMGPLPLAFDLAFPVLKAPGDKINYFNFMIGAFY